MEAVRDRAKARGEGNARWKNHLVSIGTTNVSALAGGKGKNFERHPKRCSQGCRHQVGAPTKTTKRAKRNPPSCRWPCCLEPCCLRRRCTLTRKFIGGRSVKDEKALQPAEKKAQQKEGKDRSRKGERSWERHHTTRRQKCL